MPKFILRCKANPNYFLDTQYGKEITFTDNIKEAYDLPDHVSDFESAQAHFAANHTQLAHSLFEVYEPKEYAVRAVGTEFYLSRIATPIEFVIDAQFAMTNSKKEFMEKALESIKTHFSNTKLEVVKL
jgi:hypothetical protein